jgi:hypothetical protein
VKFSGTDSITKIRNGLLKECWRNATKHFGYVLEEAEEGNELVIPSKERDLGFLLARERRRELRRQLA